MDDWLRSSGSISLVTRSLQTSPNIAHSSPGKRLLRIPGLLILHTHSPLFSALILPFHVSDTASRPPVRGEVSGSPPLGQLGSITLASDHREPGGFSQDLRRHQADHQQTLGYGSPSKESGEGWAWAQASGARLLTSTWPADCRGHGIH